MVKKKLQCIDKRIYDYVCTAVYFGGAVRYLLCAPCTDLHVLRTPYKSSPNLKGGITQVA
jgi:hypothetical protein